MPATPASSLRALVIAGLLAAMLVVAACQPIPVEDQAEAPPDPVIVAAPRAPHEGRNPEDRLLSVRDRNGNAGLIDTQGRIVVEPEYSWTSSSSEGRAVIARGDLAGFVDGTGRIVIEPTWQKAYDFREGLSVVATGIKMTFNRSLGLTISEGGVGGYIDRDGNVAIAPRFPHARPFFEGVAWVSDGERWGLIDRTGSYLIEPRFQVEPTKGFSDGLCPFWQDGAWKMEDSGEHVGYLDTSGATIIPAQFSAAGSFSEGVAAVVKGGKLGFIDRSGQVTIEPRFEWGSVGPNFDLPAFSDGLAPVRVGSGYGFIDKAGRIAIEPRYERDRESAAFGSTAPGRAMTFRDGLAAVAVDGKLGFIDREGQMIIAPQFTRVDSFENGIARVEVESGRWGYIRRDGSFLWNPIVPRDH